MSAGPGKRGTVRRGVTGFAVLGLVAGLALTGCGGGSRPVPAPVPATAGELPVAAVTWTGCGGGFQCGTVTVPVDYAHPRGATLRVAVIRRPADQPARRLGVLVFNPGGPALSGVTTLRAVAGLFPAAVALRFDLVSFDPRGTGTSDRLTCGPSLAAATAAAPAPATAGGPLPATAVYRRLAADCERRYPTLLPFVTTTDTARDLDRIRRALGEPTISFVGLSYGTLLGGEYARLFPHAVRAMILDGPTDPAAKAAGLATDQADAAEQALARARPDQLGAFDAVRRRLARAPLPAPGHGDSVPVTEGDLDLAALTFLSAPTDPGGFAAALGRAARGDGAALRTLATDQFTDVDGSSVLAPYWAITCGDLAERPSPAAAGSLARRLAARDPRLGAEAVSFYLGACPVWPAARAPLTAGRVTGLRTPVLVLGGTGDPVTPYVWAGRVAAEIGSAVLLTRVGSGHTAFFNAAGNSCLAGYESAYLINLSVPPAGRRC